MQRHFDQDLKKLNDALIEMAGLAQDSITQAIESLKNRDKSLALRVIDNDKKIDQMEIDLEELAIDLLALHQPMAGDLRFVTNALKINAELERIADLAVNISQRVLEIADQPLLKPLIDIPKMTEISKVMVGKVIQAFVRRDEALAKEVILMDPEADRYRDFIYQEIIQDYLIKDASTAPRAVPLILVSRYLERVCDHATNIAEDIIYMIKAQVVKHNPQNL